MAFFRLEVAQIMKRRDNEHSTISDVARVAGVSTATVSRVIAKNGYVSDRTKKKVQEAIDKLKYQPSLIAQSLRNKNTRVIGLIVTDIQNPFYPELVRGIEDEVQKRGYSLILCNSSEDPIREESYLNYLASQRADGIVVCASGVVDRQRKKLSSFEGKLVIINVPKKELKIPSVTSDDSAGGKLAAMHLVKCGYPKIIYIGVPREEKDGFPRYEAVKNGAGSVPVHYVLSDDTLVSGASVAHLILKKFKPPFGVIGHNDLVAIGAMHEFLAQKIKIPHEIGIVGYDNIAMSEFVSPSLTTVSQQQSTFGKHVMSLLEQLFNGEKNVKSISITPKLIERSSTTALSKKRIL